MVMSGTSPSRRRWGCLRILCVAVLMACGLFTLAIFCTREKTRQSDLIEQARDIGLLLLDYAQDNHGLYPEGKTSTEVFPKIVDGGYADPTGKDKISGAAIFYFPMPGKVKPTSKILRPENVCWDVTCCLRAISSPDQIPVVYITGYKVTYAPGASALPETWPTRAWGEWWTAADYPRGFIAANYFPDGSVLLKVAPDGTIPNFIPSSIQGDLTPYRQLTPDGKLP